MKIKLHSADSFTEIGNRENNEDNLFPPIGKSSINDSLFLVCDGVGGHYGGEIASALACEFIPAYFNQNSTLPIDNQYIEHAIDSAKKAIKEEQTRRGIYGMSTTLTLLYFGETGAIVAHLGDSRIYQLRNGKIIWQSDDHSYVNSLVKNGVITKEDARTHPKRNQITRSLNGDEDNSDDCVEIHAILDVQSQDYFFMCTDGVLEQINYDELLEFFIYNDSFNNNSERLEAIREKCYGNTNDNFTAYLIQIEVVENNEVFSPSTLNLNQAEILPIHKKNNYLLPVITSILTLMIVLGGYFWFKYSQSQTKTVESIPIINKIIPKPERINPVAVVLKKMPDKVIQTEKKVQRIPFGDNISLEVIDKNKARRFKRNDLIDRGIFHKGTGYIYYKSDEQPTYILYLEKPNKKFLLKESPTQTKHELSILRTSSDVHEKLNIASGQIESLAIPVIE